MFYFNEGSLALSDEWQDRSIMLLTHPSQVSLSISRDELALGITFAEYAATQFEMVAQQLNGYKENARKQANINGLEAIFSEFEWDSPEGHLYQISAIIDVPLHPTIITVSSSQVLSEGQKSHLISLINSFKPRQRDERRQS